MKPATKQAWSVAIFVLAISATFPQIAKTVRQGTTGDFSLANLALNFVANATIAAYSFLRREWGFFALGLWFSAYWGWLLQYTYYSNRKHESEEAVTP